MQAPDRIHEVVAMTDIPSNVGRVLERLRNDAGRPQSDIAEALGVHPSRISRFETGALQLTPDELEQYLDAIGSEAAACYRDILAERWVDITPPDPWHPDARPLIDAMKMLSRLDQQVTGDAMLPQSLASQACFLRGRLLEATSFLSILVHSFGFIGKIGDGKTTAICFGTGLTRTSQKQPRDMRDECLLATQRNAVAPPCARWSSKVSLQRKGPLQYPSGSQLSLCRTKRCIGLF
jgi:transcriptional regulator with XRE-family HTH domain